MSTVQESPTGFVNIDNAMTAARAKYAENPFLCPEVELPAYTQTLDDKDFDERFGVAFTKTKALIAQAKTQLSATCVAPRHLSASELADEAEANGWDSGYWRASIVTDETMLENDKDFGAVMGVFDDLENEDVPLLDGLRVPDPPVSPPLDSVRRVPDDVRQWVRQSKMRWKEHVVDEAREKPVLIMKPVKIPEEDGQRKKGGIGGFLKRVLSVKKRC